MSSFLIEVTNPWHNASVSEEYAPKSYEKASPEEAGQLFLQEAQHPRGYDLNVLVERLAGGGEAEHRDKETGRTVVVKPAAVGERCTRCASPYQGTPGWQKTTAGSLCPDCTVLICPEDAEPVRVAEAERS
jgi:hypothetical protein